MDPRRKLQVVSAANPSLRVSAAPKQLSVAPQGNTQLRVASAPQQQYRISVPQGTPRPTYTAPPEIKRPKQSFWNKVRDQLDANTEADKYRRQEGNKQLVRIGGAEAPGQKPIIAENPGNIISNTVGAVPRMFNTAANQIVEVGVTAQQQFATNELTRATNELLAAQKSGDKARYEAAKYRVNNASQRVSNINDLIKATKANYTENKGGLFNAGTLYNEQDSYEGKLSTGIRKIGGGTAEGMFDVASLGLTGVAGKQVAKQGFKQTIKQSGGIIAKNAALNTGQGAASSFRQGGDLTDIAISAAASGTIGTGADVALAGGGGFIARQINKLRGNADPFVKQVTKYLTQESSESAIKGILETGFSVPAENVDAIAKYVASETNSKAVDKLVKELSIDPNLELTPDVIQQLRDNGIKSVKRDQNAQYEAQYQDGVITARGQKEFDDNVYHELGHHIYINRLTPEEKALFTGQGNASKQAVGRTGYTQSDVNSEDFSDYLNKAMRGRIDEVPAEYQAVIRKYAGLADDIAATDKVPIGTITNTSTQTPTTTSKVPVGSSDVNTLRATVKDQATATQRIAEANAELDKLIASGDNSTEALTRIDQLQKTIDNLQVVEKELTLGQQGANAVTADQASKQLSGVTSQQIDGAAQAVDTTPGAATLAADTATDSAKIAGEISDAAGVRTPRADIKVFSGTIQPETQLGIDDLIARSEATPRPDGTVRVFQSNSANGEKTDWVFDNVDSLRSYKNNTTNPGDTFEFIDVPQSRLQATANGEHVFTVKEPETIVNTGNPEAVAKNVSQRGVAKSLSQTDTPPEVYENLLGYQSRPNVDTFDMAAKSIEADEQGVLQSILGKQTGALNDSESAQALLLLDKAIKNDQLELAEQIAGKINVSGTENGRAVQILSAIKKTTPEGAYLEAQKIITEAQEKGLLPKDYVLPKETVDNIKAQADYIQQVKEYNAQLEQYVQGLDPNSAGYNDVLRDLYQSNREYELSVAGLGKTLKDIVPATVGDKLNSIVNISLLLNPKTFVRNVIGNTANAIGETISTVVSTPVDMLAALKTGTRTVKLPSILKKLGGGKRGLIEGAQETELGVRIGRGGKYDINPAVFKNKAMARLEKTLGHSLSDTDKAFFSAQYDDTLDNVMRATKTDKPTQEMLDIAEHEGEYATFQHNSGISKALSATKQGLNGTLMVNGKQVGIPSYKGFGLGDVVVRYPKTPGNIVAVGMDYSPYGFFKGLVQFAKLNQKSNLAAQREAVRNLGRGITGSGLIAGGYFLAKNNIITSNKDSDKDVASLQRNQGQPPFSFNISALNRLIRGEDTKAQPGDTVATYDWLQPNAIQLSMGANMALNKDKGNADLISTALDQAATGLETIEEQPVLQQTGRFFKTATTPADRGGGIPNAIADAAVGVPSMFVPTALNQAAGAIDNTARTSYDPNPIKQAGKKVIAKLPFANQTLEPVVDTFGNEVKRQQTDNPVTRIFNSFVNPSFVTQIKQTPEGQMVLGVYDRTGEKGQFPRVTDRKMDINGSPYTLSPKEITEFQKYTGKKTKEAFGALAKNPSFMALSDEEKAKTMSGIVTDIASAARIEILGNKPKTMSDDVKAIINGKTLNYISKVPEGVSKAAEQYYQKTAYMDEATYKEWLNGAPDEVAQTVAKELNGRRPKNTNELTAYNGLAKRYAEYEKSKAEAKAEGKWTKLDEIEKEQDFWKGAIKDGREELTKDIYDAGSSGAEDYIKQGLISKADIDKAIELDNELYASGLSKTLKFSKTFRRSYGYGIPASPGEKASGSGGGKGGGGGSSKTKKTGVNELKLRYTPDAAPTISRVPRNVQLKLNKPASVQVTPVRIRL